MYLGSSVALLIVGMLFSAYFGWAFYRTGAGMDTDPAFPRPFPWPDYWLIELHDWYDQQNPTEPGTFKISGELRRLRVTVFAAFGVSFAILLTGVGCALQYRRSCKIHDDGQNSGASLFHRKQHATGNELAAVDMTKKSS